MGNPLHKIKYQEKYDQLHQRGQCIQGDQSQRLEGDPPITKYGLKNTVKTRNDNGKNEEIKYHVEGIQPKVFSKNFLIFSPGEGNFHQPNYD